MADCIHSAIAPNMDRCIKCGAWVGLGPEPAASGGDSASLEKHSDGMLPDELVTHSKEWYRLCERRFSVERMTISGELAEAIVACISRLNEPFGNSEQLASLERRARELFDSMMDSAYGGSTIGHIVCAETTRGRLESAWLPLITAALASQQGVGDQ